MPLDFYYLWAAGKLLAEGLDPYDSALLAETVIQAGYPAAKYVPPIPYPPWTVALMSILAPLGFYPAFAVWTLLAAASVAYGVKLLSRTFLPSTPARAVVLWSLVFFPLVKLLLFGQTSFLVLLAVVLFAEAAKAGRYLLAGAALALSLFKPHLGALIWVYALSSFPRAALPAFATGALGVMALLAALPLLEPAGSDLFRAFFEVVFTHTQRVETDCSLSAWFAAAFGGRLGWSLLFLLIAGVTLTIQGLRSKFNRDWFYVHGLPIAMLGTPFFWSHDLVVLFPTYLALCEAIRRRKGEAWSVRAAVALTLVQAALTAALFENLIVFVPILFFACSPYVERGLKRDVP